MYLDINSLRGVRESVGCLYLMAWEIMDSSVRMCGLGICGGRVFGCRSAACMWISLRREKRPMSRVLIR